VAGGGHIDIIEADGNWALATRGRLMVTVWRTGVTLARVNAVDTTIRALVPRVGKSGYGAITVLEPGIALGMPEEARDASTALQKRWDGHMKCSGYLVEGSGFLPAAVRTMTAGMALFTRSKAQIKVFPDTPTISEWIAPFVGLEPREVARTLMDVRGAGVDRPLTQTGS
jgi:hypothetical protein